MFTELAALVWLFGWPGAIAIIVLIFFALGAATTTPAMARYTPPDPKLEAERAARLAAREAMYARIERRLRRLTPVIVVGVFLLIVLISRILR
jgi:hypothetical protein